MKITLPDKVSYLRDIPIITAGSFILAFGINYFLVPSKLSTGGVSGIGTVLYYLFSVPMSITTLMFNAALFAVGLRTLERTTIRKTIYGILLLSLFLEITKSFGHFGGDLLLSSLFGGILSGFGVGLTVLRNASTGGSDLAAIMLNKRLPHITVPNFIFAIDTVIILASGIIYRNTTVMLYSLLTLYIASKIADNVLVRGDRARSVLIISQKSAEISKIILTSMSRGVTGIYSKGLYNQSDSMMLLCIVRSKEIPELLAIVKNTDNAAFTVISEVREVRGEGFKNIR